MSAATYLIKLTFDTPKLRELYLARGGIQLC